MDDVHNAPIVVYKIRTFSKLNKFELLVLIMGTIGLLFSMAVAIYNLANDSHKKSDVPVSENIIFSIIAIICSIFTISYLYRGIFEERSYELIIYVISAISLMFYIIINYATVMIDKKSENILISVRLGISLLIIPATAIIGSLLAYNYNIKGKLIFYTVGSVQMLQDCCKHLFIFQGLLQLDFQFELCMITLCICQTSKIGIFQYIVLAIGVPFSILWRIYGHITIKRENRIGSYIFFVFGFIEPSYIIYITYNTIKNIINSHAEPILFPVTTVASVTFACCLLSLLIRITLLVMSIVVIKNFGKGLKEKCIGSLPEEKKCKRCNEWMLLTKSSTSSECSIRQVINAGKAFNSIHTDDNDVNPLLSSSDQN